VFDLVTIEVIFLVSGIAVQAAWACRLWSLCLSGRYRGLGAYLIVTTVWGVVGSLFRYGIPQAVIDAPDVWSSFAWFYVATRPVIWLLFFIVLYECYERMVAEYPGVRRAGQLTLYTAVVAAVSLIVGLTITNPEQAGTTRYWYRMIVTHDESVYIAAASAVLLLVLFRRFFSLPLPGNVGVIFGAFGAYFIGSAAICVAENMTLSDGFTAGLGIAGSALYLSCLVFGVVRFSPAKEVVADDFRSGAGHSLALTANNRLDRINDQLVRALNV
jgi:hypothetical protein